MAGLVLWDVVLLLIYIGLGVCSPATQQMGTTVVVVLFPNTRALSVAKKKKRCIGSGVGGTPNRFAQSIIQFFFLSLGTVSSGEGRSYALGSLGKGSAYLRRQLINVKQAQDGQPVKPNVPCRRSGCVID